jgi:hypothetical protein
MAHFKYDRIDVNMSASEVMTIFWALYSSLSSCKTNEHYKYNPESFDINNGHIVELAREFARITDSVHTIEQLLKEIDAVMGKNKRENDLQKNKSESA